MLPTLHILGLPHTETTDEHSHCAFTGKVKRMAPMMKPLGYNTIHYGVGNPQSGADEQIQIMDVAEQQHLINRPRHETEFYAQDADASSRLYQVFNARLRQILLKSVVPGDLVLNTFGSAHFEAVRQDTEGGHRGINVESGIGYNETWTQFRIFESLAWMHYHLGKYQRDGNFYEWVIPNYFDPAEWTVQPNTGSYVLFLGRISDTKGCAIIPELAKRRPSVKFVLCGQGDPSQYLTQPNITYRPPVKGKERDALVGNALCMLAPSKYVEPGGGSAVESMLTGTPVLSVPWGCFTETVQHGQTGYHCRTLFNWVEGIDKVHDLDRRYIARRARMKYSLSALAPQYDTAFRMIKDLHTGGGWDTFTR